MEEGGKRPEDEGPAVGSFDELLLKTLEVDGEDSEMDIVPLPLGNRILGPGDLMRGRYRIERILARGGVGFVLRALDVRLDRTVAIKLLLPHFATNPKARARFELEAKVAAKIDSEHVPRVIDVGELDDGAQFIVMEYLRGEELSRLLERRGKLPVTEGVEVVSQICAVVALAHAAGIVHRDLKPANVFLATRADGSRCVKVLDFGVAKMRGLNRPHGDALIPNAASSVVGTPRYMAPEQISADAAADERVDIWALGAILFEVVAGRPAFDAAKITDVFEAIREGDPPRIRSIVPEAPEALDAVIRKCLQKNPAARYADAEELAAALLPMRPAARPRRRRQLAMVAILIAAAAALAIALFVAMSRRAPPNTDDVTRMGDACSSDGECGSLGCIDRICTRTCEHNASCPGGSKCMSDGVCAVPLRVAFVYVGVPEDEGWTGTHDRGRKAVEKSLPYLETDFVSDAHRPGVAERAIDDFVDRGFHVVVANSFSLRDAVAKKAKEHPKTKFLIYAYPPAPEVGAFGGHLEQAWYLAGFAAAQRSRSKRLGFVGSLVTPEVVRYINAFTRGARRFEPQAVVDVRWIGFWFDTGPADAKGRHKEELLTEQLLADGCDVIAHNADNGRVVEAVEAAHSGAVSIANNNPAGCEKGPSSCLGAVAWNWEPLYASIFEDIHRGSWRPDKSYQRAIVANPAQSTVNFVMNRGVAGSKLALEVAPVLAGLANDAAGLHVFDGPYCSTGQRTSCVDAGAAPPFEELRTMCWYVDGVVDKVDPANPASADRPGEAPQPACSEQQ